MRGVVQETGESRVRRCVSRLPGVSCNYRVVCAGGAGLATQALLGAEGIACLFTVTTAELKVNLNLDP